MFHGIVPQEGDRWNFAGCTVGSEQTEIRLHEAHKTFDTRV